MDSTQPHRGGKSSDVVSVKKLLHINENWLVGMQGLSLTHLGSGQTRLSARSSAAWACLGQAQWVRLGPVSTRWRPKSCLARALGAVWLCLYVGDMYVYYGTQTHARNASCKKVLAGFTERGRNLCQNGTGSLSDMSTLLPKSSRLPRTAGLPIHATWPSFHSKTLYVLQSRSAQSSEEHNNSKLVMVGSHLFV